MSTPECANQNYYRCGGEESYEHQTSSWSHSWVKHEIDHEIIVDLGFKSLQSLNTKRTFMIEGSSSSTTQLYHVRVVGCEGLATPPCLSWCTETEWDYTGSVSENCVILKEEILYLDMSNKTLLFKRTQESLVFSSSSKETCGFRGKWGTQTHHKIKIDGAKIQGLEEFVLIFAGTERVLWTLAYEREPEWMMGPIGIPTTGNGVVYQTDCDGYDDVQQILVYGNPPSKSIPTDTEILCKGFYDYGSEFPGDIPQLVIDDGGYKDYFYPSWIRSMMLDPLWKERAADRYLMWLAPQPPPRGDYTVSCPEPLHSIVPCGNGVYRMRDGVQYHDAMFSFAFQDRDGNAHILTELNGQDPKHRVIALGVTGYGSEWGYAPIGLL